MRRRLLLNSSGPEPVDPSQAAPMEVAFYNSDIDDIVIRKQEEWLDGETPIGIVVVPGYHDRYGDGSCGVMSLVCMDYNHPTSGMPVTGASQTDNVYMYWGDTSSISNNIFAGTIALNGTNNYIPYQKSNTSTDCSADSGALVWPYAGTLTKPTSGASTEYSNDGGYVTATTGKAACDFNGIRNTAACYIKTRTATQWTASTVENYWANNNTPAAACAGRFKTVGTKSFLDAYSDIGYNNRNYGTPTSTKDNKGFWYLPAEGELCCIPRYMHEINKTILALNQKYGNVGVQLNLSQVYMSSSEYSSSKAWIISMYNGYMENFPKNNGYNTYVRAFMRL